jgi:hypothetical protein
MKITEQAWYAMIWIGGDYSAAVQACREFCAANPLCVTVTPAAYVYTGGMEDGVCVRLIQYPRFPRQVAEIRETASRLAEHLRAALFQSSYSIECTDSIEWTSYRDEQPVSNNERRSQP